MKILHLSCHSVLEYLNLRLLTEMPFPEPIEVFSLGAYMNPLQEGDFMRSVIPKGTFYQNLYQVAMQCDKDNIHDELLEWADVVFMMHNSAIPGQKEQQAWLVRNWDKFMKYDVKVVWQSIGQSTPAIEEELQQYRNKGLKIVRYSPSEEKIPNYAGSDALIRFYEDENELKGWHGDKQQVITLAQSFKKRGEHLGYHIFDRATEGFNRKVFGTENEDLLGINGGRRTYSELKHDLKEARVFFYFGTIPAPYTLSLIEAMMTGIPIVAVGPKLREMQAYPWQQYDIPSIINHGVNGYYSDNVDDLKGYIRLLMEDHEKAKRVGEAGRKTAIELFGKQERMAEWSKFLQSI